MAQNITGLHGMLNMKAAAHYVGMYVGNFRRQVKKQKNRPAHYKIGFRYYFNKEDLDSWLESFKSK